jgi:hypothetical protein
MSLLPCLGRSWSQLVAVGRSWSQLVAVGRSWSQLVADGQTCRTFPDPSLVAVGRRRVPLVEVWLSSRCHRAPLSG